MRAPVNNAAVMIEQARACVTFLDDVFRRRSSSFGPCTRSGQAYGSTQACSPIATPVSSLELAKQERMRGGRGQDVPGPLASPWQRKQASDFPCQCLGR